MTTRRAHAHEGEQAVRQRVGAVRRPPVFGPELNQGFADFIRAQRMLVIGAADDDGHLWATAVTGPAGFADPVDETTVVLSGEPAAGDPLRGAFAVERDCGTLALDPVTGRRVRANGTLRDHGGRLVLRTEQVLRNCTKYIQKREPVGDADPAEPVATTGDALSARQQDWIAGADTFFIASRSPAHGADVSHRGGRPGFVAVSGSRRLSWPDYRGNSFFMTLGNLELDPACGLLFLDWQRGRTLHLTGRALVDWEDASAPGAERTIHFDVTRVVEIGGATALRWKFVEHSPFNPDQDKDGTP
ncbi:pyridoxamine 5'-phosphate oxidase family protein [Actinosynnema sp. NPDC091369]